MSVTAGDEHLFILQRRRTGLTSSRFLLANSTERDAVDQWGRTPLHLAAKEDAEDSICALLAAHAPTHRIDVHGETPLHYAARADCDRAVAILLATGAKFSACN